MQALKTSLIAFAEPHEKPRTKGLEFKFSLNRLLHCIACLVRRMKTRAAAIARI
jgi:hypothetical protein